MTTATFPSQSKVVHRTSLGCLFGGCAEVDQLIILRATVFDTMTLDKLEIPLPFASNGKVARVAPNGDWKVHVPCSWYLSRLPFFLSAEETMKRAYLVLGGLVLLLILSFALMGRQQMYPGAVEDLSARVQKDLANEKRRFLPENSLDIGMAMKMITHDPPSMLAPPAPQPPLLLFPPSEETLARLSGV